MVFHGSCKERTVRRLQSINREDEISEQSGTRQWPYHCVIRCTFGTFGTLFFRYTFAFESGRVFFFFFGKSGIASNEGRRSTMTIL